MEEKLRCFVYFLFYLVIDKLKNKVDDGIKIRMRNIKRRLGNVVFVFSVKFCLLIFTTRSLWKTEFTRFLKEIKKNIFHYVR